MNIPTKKSKRSLRRTVSIAAATASLAALGAAALASPASALSREVVFGHPGDVSFAEKGRPTVVFQATDKDNRGTHLVTFSSGVMTISPDPIAKAGKQWAMVTYHLLRLDLDGTRHLVYETNTRREIRLWNSHGDNMPTTFDGLGKLTTLKVAPGERYTIEVTVDRYVGTEWQSDVILAPNQSSEVDCRVDRCSANVPRTGPAYFAFG
jgi:hypothetical protein